MAAHNKDNTARLPLKKIFTGHGSMSVDVVFPRFLWPVGANWPDRPRCHAPERPQPGVMVAGDCREGGLFERGACLGGRRLSPVGAAEGSAGGPPRHAEDNHPQPPQPPPAITTKWPSGTRQATTAAGIARYMLPSASPRPVASRVSSPQNDSSVLSCKFCRKLTKVPGDAGL